MVKETRHVGCWGPGGYAYIDFYTLHVSQALDRSMTIKDLNNVAQRQKVSKAHSHPDNLQSFTLPSCCLHASRHCRAPNGPHTRKFMNIAR